MKKILSLTVLLGGLSLGAFAQDKQVQEPRVRKEKIERKAELEKKSPEEIAKIRAARKNRMQYKQQLAKKAPEEIAKFRTERLDKELKFTDAQRDKVYSYTLERVKNQTERDKVRKQDRLEMRRAMKTERENFSKLLSEEQQKIWTEKMAKQEGRRFHKGGKHIRDGKDSERLKRRKIEKISEERTIDSSNG